ncbi:MAG: S9 family peptidase, partial [Bacteroidota bacterium]|nr:S9 family peptidase [Bacteroidota bacterium]
MKFIKISSTLAILFTVASFAQPLLYETVGQYPITKKGSHVDTYFGVQVADPYRWLESDTSKEVADWVKEQNKATFGYLEKIPFR